MSDSILPTALAMPENPGRRRLVGAGFVGCAAAGLAPLAEPVRAAPDAQAILAASDEVRNPPRAFAVTVTLLEFRAGKQTDSNTLNVYTKTASEGAFRTLIRIAAPARDADKLLLKNGNDLWFYDPASQASVRLSPQQRLLGQAANGDVVTVNLAREYTAEWLAEEDVADGERVMRRAVKLGLSAAMPDVTYHRAEVWVDKANARPIRARFFAESGRLLKTAVYRKYQPALGRERPTEVIIIDGLDGGWVTVLRYSDWAYRDIPDLWFQREYLPRFRPE